MKEHVMVKAYTHWLNMKLNRLPEFLSDFGAQLCMTCLTFPVELQSVVHSRAIVGQSIKAFNHVINFLPSTLVLMAAASKCDTSCCTAFSPEVENKTERFTDYSL